MKKILIVGYLPPPYGGLEAMTKLILDSKPINNKYDVCFFKIKTMPQAGQRGRTGVLNIIYNLWNLIKYILVLFKENPDLVYCSIAQNRNGFLRDSFFIRLAKFINIKVVVHFHGGNFDKFYLVQPAVFKTYIRTTLKRIDRLIVLSRTIQNQFLQFLPLSKMGVIYNAVNLEPFNRPNLPAKGKVNQTPVVLFIGYISKAKGALDLVKAIKVLVRDKNIKAQFCLIGSIINIEKNIVFIDQPDNAFEKISAIIKDNNLQDNVKIYPDSSQDFKISSLLEADLFVFPSYSEGFGLVVLEAMAAGLAVVMTKVGGLAENLIEGENCFFVNPGDSNGLALKIAGLLEDSVLRKKMGENNRALVNNKFTPERFANELAGVWGNCLQAII